VQGCEPMPRVENGEHLANELHRFDSLNASPVREVSV
jgi:hypothetical protein